MLLAGVSGAPPADTVCFAASFRALSFPIKSLMRLPADVASALLAVSWSRINAANTDLDKMSASTCDVAVQDAERCAFSVSVRISRQLFFFLTSVNVLCVCNNE